MKLYLDDEREAPEGWIRVKTAHEAIQLLELNRYDIVSLDHDLGTDHHTKPNNGYDVIEWLEEQILCNGYTPIPTIFVHTANPAARRKMTLTVSNIQRASRS